ncbi:MAG: non-reducing end alpha-L-arabinofuranosidase family hydrolase [Pirellulales bacterium]
MSPAARPADPCHAIKDPTVVFHDGRWRLFCTIRSARRTHQIEYLSFTDWEQADQADRHVLAIEPGYFCAPQVFYFRPHRKWYLIFQTSDESRQPSLQPAYSTSDNLEDPQAWTKPALLFAEPPVIKAWIDFWVICDSEQAHLFFTSLDGRMWRSATPLDKFPHGWSTPEVALEADLFEASHTYRLTGVDRFLTVIEAQAEGRRYYKAYLADRLAGPWRPLADSVERPFAGRANVGFKGPAWTDSISHGELLRAANDETLPVDPKNLRFLFQGVSDQERAGKDYGQIPWRLGLLEPTVTAE